MSLLVRSSIKSSMSLLLLLLASATTTQAATFTTSLESTPDQTDPALTTTVNNGGLSADFTGGTIDFLGIALLYHPPGVKSWMVAPSGDTAPMATGMSTGMGTIKLSAGADSIQVFGRTESAATVAEVRVFDTAAMMISGPTALINTS